MLSRLLFFHNNKLFINDFFVKRNLFDSKNRYIYQNIHKPKPNIMSSESHKNARKMMSFNTLAFIVSSVFFVYFVGMLFYSLLTAGTILTGPGIFSSVALVGYVLISLRHVRRSWKSFSDLNYKTSITSGIIAWVYPLGMILLAWLLR
ncbi:hypothetical protein M23134_03214 [Microscilla marina ATCC 23134]|uniref:Uncharacterized protein n=2 Tax=Microscilla marina TaxID=1027 RepID=A1ZGF9_MICM2|nr:hypothetical protein M23134_03214 [Microscilla marina ATCC 23134]